MLKASNLLFCVYFVLFSITAAGQVKTSDLDSLLVLYRQSPLDTNKVKNLLQIDSIYSFKMASKSNVLDSGILMAKQARAFSTSLRFQQGYDEATFLLARTYAKKNDMQAARNVMNETAGELKIHILIIIAEHFTFLPGELKENLDSARPYILQAYQLSQSIKSFYWLYESLCIMGKYYYSMGDFERGKNCFNQIIQYYHQKGDNRAEAHWWEELAVYMPDSKESYADEVYAYEKALAMYKELDQKNDQRSILMNLAYVHQIHKEIDLAEEELGEALRLAHETGSKKTFRILENLSQINLSKGNYNRSLYYSLEAVKNLDSSGEYEFAGAIYFNLAESYHALGNTDKSLEWYYKSLGNLVARKDQYLFAICSRIVTTLLEQGKYYDALNFAENFGRKNKPVRFIDQEMMAANLGNCYKAVGKYALAEKYYLQMIRLDTLTQAQRSKQLFPDDQHVSITSSDAYLLIGKFYVEQGVYNLAKKYLARALTDGLFVPPLTQLRDIHLLIFKVDSAQENYQDAIKHLQTAKALNDSVFNIAKSKQIEELQIKYETDKKDQDLKLLSSNEQLQKKELQRAAQAREFIYALVIVLLVLTGFVYSRYRIKQRANNSLKVKQDEINQKNTALEQFVVEKDELISEKDDLLLEKDKLLQEKEWLVKEIHHRVKNNLQIVVSLLSTQSKYLDNEEAIEAISESRHRMQAMALIHQKLYQSEMTTSVNMQTYIQELAEYLEESFNSTKQIHLKIDVDPITLDIAQAIPLGLILNELITNAFKYAFAERESGNIFISMHLIDEKNILLEVRDNGKGIDANLDIKNLDSMGMRLIKGLTKQINGMMTMESAEGLLVRIEFTADEKLKHIEEQQNEIA